MIFITEAQSNRERILLYNTKQHNKTTVYTKKNLHIGLDFMHHQKKIYVFVQLERLPPTDFWHCLLEMNTIDVDIDRVASAGL